MLDLIIREFLYILVNLFCSKDYQTILSSITARLPNTEIINYSGETKEIPFDFLSKVLNQVKISIIMINR